MWNLIIELDDFSKKTVGAQFVNAADSISANLAEIFGRWGKKIKSSFTDTAKVQGRNGMTEMKSPGTEN